MTVLSAGNYYDPVAGSAHIPFRVIIGERDNKTALGNAGVFIELMQQHSYDVQLHIIPNAGHRVTRAARGITIDFFEEVYGVER